jgi:uncharacterized protein YhaN
MTTEAEVAQIIENLRQTVKASDAKDKYIKQLEMQADRMRAELAKAREALAGILRNHETIGAGASIFQCTTAEVKAARDAMSVR